MARAKVFISSTYYDLKHIRASLEAFIQSMGYESVLFESGDIPFHHDKPLDESCYQEIQNCHMLVLIVGGRYGSPTSDASEGASKEQAETYKRFNSITKKEYETARDRDVPIYIFVDKNVLAEYQTFKKNRENSNINYAYVDSINIFYLLDDILAQHRNNYIQGFEKFDDISSWLRDQWSGLLADFLAKRKTETSLADLSSQVQYLKEVSSVLREYSEIIIQKLQPEKSSEIIQAQQEKLLTALQRQFSAEPMIRWLKHEFQSIGIEHARHEYYKAFIESNSIDDYLKRLGVSEEVLQRILSPFEEPARRDYSALKSKYDVHPDLVSD